MLITGKGTSGSFKIRGDQLGAAIGATVLPNALDVGGYSVAVIVKRPPHDLVERIHKAGVPLVWDVVDSHPQPIGNSWDRATCRAWLHDQVKKIKPAGIVAATKSMAIDMEDVAQKVLTLPHHSRPNQRSNPIREKVSVVGYEGGNYLGRWKGLLEAECKRRGWKFVENPPQLADLDIVVALREATGYACRAWKSNVKLANAQGTGTPFIGNRELGYVETQSGAERWADTPAELTKALDELTDYEARKSASLLMKQCAPMLPKIADTYKAWLKTF